MAKIYTALLRISIGFVFLWGFLDKLFGLGFSTDPAKSWLMGASPTAGYLSNATRGPFAEIFQSLTGNPITDWLFMLGLLGVGTAFVLGIALRFSSYAGAMMMALLYLSAFPPTTNPLIDDHVIYALLLLFLAQTNSGNYLGLGKNWNKSLIVKTLPFLRN